MFCIIVLVMTAKQCPRYGNITLDLDLLCIKTSKSIYKILRENIGHYYQHCILFWFV